MLYSIDLRKRVLKYIEDVGSTEEAVTIWNWIKRNKQGALSPKVKEVRPRKIDKDKNDSIKKG